MNLNPVANAIGFFFLKKASAREGEGAGRGPGGLRKSVQVSVAQASLLACMTERSHGRIASTPSWVPSRKNKAFYL